MTQATDEGGPEEFARQAPFRTLVNEWLREEMGSVEADNVGKTEFTGLVRLCERAVAVAAGPELLAACKEQHAAIDTLMARLILQDPEFFPTKVPEVWAAVLQGHAAIAKAQPA